MPMKSSLLTGLGLLALLAAVPSITLAQAPSAPPAAKPPLTAPETVAPREAEAAPEADAPVPHMVPEDDEDEEGEQAMPGEGCPFLGNKLELLV